MAGFPYLSQIADHATAKALGSVMSDVAALKRRMDTLEAEALRNTGDLNVNGKRITNLATPTTESDAVTVAFMRQFVQAQVETF